MSNQLIEIKRLIYQLSISTGAPVGEFLKEIEQELRMDRFRKVLLGDSNGF
jgi:hypothetical protein